MTDILPWQGVCDDRVDDAFLLIHLSFPKRKFRIRWMLFGGRKSADRSGYYVRNDELGSHQQSGRLSFLRKSSSSDSFHWHPYSGENSHRSFQQKRDDSAPNERGFYHYLRIPEYVSSRAWLYAKHGRGGKGGSERNAFLKKRKFRFRRNETFFFPVAPVTKTAILTKL